MPTELTIPNTVVSVVRESQEETLKEILSDDLIQSHAKTQDGKLSAPQTSLVSTTVSLMQDRIISNLERQFNIIREELMMERHLMVALAERTASIRSEVVKLYNTPFLTAPKESEEIEEEQAQAKAGILRYVTWGNALAITTMFLFAVSVYYTRAYANYKDRVSLQSKEIVRLEDQLKDIAADRDTVLNEKEKSTKDALREKERGDREHARYLAIVDKHDDLNKRYQEVIKSSGAESELRDQRDKAITERDKERARADKLQSDVTTLTREKTLAEADSQDYKRRWGQYKAWYDQQTRSVRALKKHNDDLLKDNERLKRQR